MSTKLDKDKKRLYNQKLIEFVHSHPILFNTRLDDYKNNVKKNFLWNRFGEEQFPTDTGEYFNSFKNAFKIRYKLMAHF